MRTPARPLLFSRPISRVHCVGVGGMGMGPLAVYLSQLGFAVTGEDDALTEDVRTLLAREHVIVGPMVATAEIIVYSSAISPTHPAYVAAVARKLPIVRRGEMLAEVLRGRRLVAVCGSHGKTTTTAMLITALRKTHFPAGWVLGGLFADDTPPANVGSSDWVVAEIDESDGTIGLFTPEITVAVNLDWDHPDHYRRAADFEQAFADLFARTKGTLLVSDTCAPSARLAPNATTFGRNGRFSGIASGWAAGRTTLRLGGDFPISTATINAHGEFNALNATGALAAAQLMGARITTELLVDYPGVRRRQAILLKTADLTVIEDYAHHPSEIRALLSSLRQRVGDGRLIVVFQPHRFSRTAQFRAEFADALTLADRVHLLDVYGAGEAPIDGGTTADIYVEFKRLGATVPVSYLPGGDAELFRALAREIRGGELVAFVGAGDIDRKARAWLEVRQADHVTGERWIDILEGIRPQLAKESKLRRDEPLANKTTLRVGGAARLYGEPATQADLQTMLQAAAENRIGVFVLGRGSNLIVPDDGVDGLVISLVHENWAGFEALPDGRVRVGAGLRLKNLCGLATKAGLTGFEFLEGIPGSVGGALRMNAGAMGGWMFDVVDEVQLVTMGGEVQTLPKDAMHVAYRHCAELRDAVALSAVLRPSAKSDAESVARQVDVYKRKRQESQPREPSAGCIFKNPEGQSAGKLIDESGLKGERVGDAEVSPVHANFIVNRGSATGADVIELVRRVRARVRQAKGVDLEPEVLLYGRDWKDVL